MAQSAVRLVHVFTRTALARVLASTYASASRVDEEEAHERLLQALSTPRALEDLQRGLAQAISARESPRMPADRLMDRLSKGLGARGGKVRAAAVTPAVAAVVVRLDLELGLSDETMRATLATSRGAAALEEGLAALGKHVVAELLRK